MATSYVVSTRERVDREQAVARLHKLMNEQVFADETLTLSGLAQMLDPSPHPLSERLNTRELSFPKKPIST